jgi:hypothetical protein
VFVSFDDSSCCRRSLRRIEQFVDEPLLGHVPIVVLDILFDRILQMTLAGWDDAD